MMEQSGAGADRSRIVIEKSKNAGAFAGPTPFFYKWYRGQDWPAGRLHKNTLCTIFVAVFE